MRIAGNILFPSRQIVFTLAVCLLLLLRPLSLMAGQASLVIAIQDDATVIETGLYPLAYDSDSAFCGDRLLERGNDYTINVHTGRLTFVKPPGCDTIILSAFQIPRWLASPSGNPVPQGKRLLNIPVDIKDGPHSSGISPQKISLSGNKSFSFTVGRSGQGHFSQGLNVDFDARMANDLRLRGSVSDRVGSGNQFLPGAGGTLILSELDKYFFEIDGKRVIARGGDINAVQSKYLPAKRIKGIYALYDAGPLKFSGDLGRPAGRFVSRKLMGIDGRQGPYQASGSDGVPTGIVPGSEKIYLDGRLLEGGADKHYLVDYPSGRVTFSPRVLITSRSRIELDFEAANDEYEQVVYDGAVDIKLWDGKLKFNSGGRRETDDKDKLRFGSLSANDIAVLQAAGDTSSLAFTDGAVSDTSGSYQLQIDSLGNEYYKYVGSDSGDYSVAFSFVGEGKGDYQYLGDGVYQYMGAGAGNYLPIRFLSLPLKNDFFFSAVELIPYKGSVWRLEYQGNDRDKNLFSPLDDGDNFKSQITGQILHAAKSFNSLVGFRYRQEEYNPVYRVDPPDNSRQWALSPVILSGDELRIYLNNEWKKRHNRLASGLGYLSYKNNLRSYRLSLTGNLWDDKIISPRFDYQLGNSEKVNNPANDGLYEKLNPRVSIKAIKRVRFDFDFDRELIKNGYGTVPDVEQYLQYRSAVYIGRSVLSVSRRVEHRSGDFGVKGPQQDKIGLTSEETFGRFQLSLAGTWFDQKKLDSDRDDRTERLFVTSLRYAPSSAWLTLRAEYRQNRQSVRASGFRYIQVNSGEGDYRLEEGNYLFDPDGDYIRIREELGGATSVSVGEKNHNIVVYPGRLPLLKPYRKYFSQIAFRLRTEVIEEMPGGDRRTISWLFPWASRSGIEYIKRFRREKYTWLLFPAFNFYILNFSYGNSFEEQESGGLVYRSNKEYEIEIKNQLSPVMRTRLGWHHQRKYESGASAIAIRLETDTYSAGLIINPKRLQVTPGLSYIRFFDRHSGGEGRGVVFLTEAIWRQPEKGEIRLNTELRSLTEKIAFNQPEYLVTDGRRFGRSALINLVVNYEIGKTWRLTVNLTDRIHEGRPAEFVGRGELLARF